MSGLADELAAAEARVAQLKLQIAEGACVETGHDWRMLGGRNAGCDDDCRCSVPVHVCQKCGDCDYGDNAEATEVMASCAALEAALTQPNGGQRDD